jgi:hypothetical protein
LPSTELIQGECPFISATKDPVEIIHLVLAATPQPFIRDDARAADVADPLIHALGILQQIVFKLLAKAAEDRYQTAIGLLADLQWLSAHFAEGQSSYAWQMPTSKASGGALLDRSVSATAAISEVPSWATSFQLGAFDLASTFRISGRLYGRAKQVRTLLGAFNRVSGSRLASEIGDAEAKLPANQLTIMPPSWSDGATTVPKYGGQYSTEDTAGVVASSLLASSNHLETAHRYGSTITQAVGRNTPLATAVRPEIVLLSGYSGIGQ